MAKLINTKEKIVIKLDMKRLLMSRPYIKVDGFWLQADGTFAGIISDLAYSYVKEKREEIFVGRKFSKTQVELVGDEFVVTFTENLAKKGR